MSDFWLNFLANFLSSAIVALAFYIAITQRSERKTQQLRIKQFLGMLKAEWELDMTRAKHLVKEFELGHETTLTRTTSRRYTRGVWNALKENSFLVQLTDARLVYYLLRANEALVVANSSLAKFQKAIGVDEGENIGPLLEKAKGDSQRLITALDKVLPMLNAMKLPDYTQEEFDEPELDSSVSATQ